MRFAYLVITSFALSILGCKDSKAGYTNNGVTDAGQQSNGSTGGPFSADAKPLSGASQGARITAPSGNVYVQVGILGKGAAGEVFLARREKDNQSFAMKKTLAGAKAEFEIAATKAVTGRAGFAQLIEGFTVGSNAYIVLGRIGQSIESIRTRGGRILDLPRDTIGSIGLQMVERLEVLHSLGFVHMDMYPNNVAVSQTNANELVLFDFGEAKPYGGAGPSRMSDIQSLSHSVLQLLKPGTRYGDYKHYQDAGISLETLCEGLPVSVLNLFKYSHETLGRSDAPNYEYIRSILMDLSPLYAGKLIWHF